ALKAAVNAELNSEKVNGKTDRVATDPVYDLEIAQLKSFSISGNAGVKNLKGLEKAIGLETFDIGLYGSNSSNNNITNIDVVENFKNLKEMRLGVGVKNISDLTKLVSLSNLERLYISSADVEDISAVSHLTNLEQLYIRNSKVHDISAISSLTKLVDLRLPNNHISDFSPLKDIVGNLTTFDAKNQEIIAEKQEVTGAKVQLDPIKMIMPDGTEVSTPTKLSEGVFQDGKITLNWSENQEREISYTLNGVGTYKAITANVKQLVNFTYTGAAKQEVDMPDAALKAAVNAELNSEKINGKTDRATTDPVYDLELAQMKKLDKQKANITNLKGLEKATSLTSLTLHYNKISDLTPLENLTQLNVLNIAVMPTLTDISPIKNLTNLTQLNLGENSITDIS
ncbi:hypothetical protein DUI34_13820, partial [Enterococcus faecium]|nr:hypothetical protein [Enterococcus faecium]